MYNMPRTIAKHYATGTALKRGSVELNCRFIPAEEESLKQWILLINRRSMPLRIATVQQMANILVIQYAGSTILKPIGQYWVQNYIKRYDDLRL